MPTLGELTTSVFRDLADEGKQVFTTLQVEDFIRGGIVELNRVAPTDAVEDIDFVSGQVEYPTIMTLVYGASLRDKTGRTVAVLSMLEPGQPHVYGYVHRIVGERGVIEVTPGLVDAVFADTTEDANRPHIRLAGYARRPLPYPYSVLSDPDDTASPLVAVDPRIELGGDEEFAIREYAKAEGFTLLTHDRSLYQQWQGQTNNTDVSPVMMLNMASTARAEWNRRRGLIRTVRRYE
jgi:hypothetical protein